MPLIWAVLKCKCSAPSQGVQPASDSLSSPSSLPLPPSLPFTLTHCSSILLCHPSLYNTNTVHSRAHSTSNPYSAASPHSPYVCQCAREQTRATTICTSCGGWDSWFLFNRNKMRKVSYLQRDMRVNSMPWEELRWTLIIDGHHCASLSFGSHFQSKVLQCLQEVGGSQESLGSTSCRE